MTEKDAEEEKYCPRCWRRIPADVTYCPSCGMMAEKTKPSEEERTKLLTTGALLATIAGAVCFIAGISSSMMVILASLSFYPESNDPLYNTAFHMFTIVAISDLLGFILGGTAALNAWKKTGFKFTLVATALLPIIGLLNFTVMYNNLGYDPSWASMFGATIIILSLPSLVIMAATKQEFTQVTENP